MGTDKPRFLKVVVEEKDGLDSITAYLDDYGRGAGMITIVCYGKAWTAFWGGMGDRSLSEFFCDTGDDYLFGKLNIVSPRRTPKHEEKYLKRIINAVKKALQD